MSGFRFLGVTAASIPTPPSGCVTLFLDSATGIPSFKDDGGTVTPITSGDAELAAIAGLTSAANKIPMFSGSGTATLLDRDTDGTLAANSDTSLATQKATKTYVDAKVAGLSWKQAVRAATTAAGTLATDFENGDTVDGVVLATGDRILVKNQAAATENGIYVVAASGAPARATDADSGAELVNASIYVSEGTANADTQWVCTTNATITIGATNLTFAQFTSAGGSQPLDADLTALAAITRTRGDLIVGGAADWVRLALGTAGQRPKSDGTDVVWVDDFYTIPLMIDGGGAVITTGFKGVVQADIAGTIVAATVLAADNLTGSIVIDIWKDTYANHPPTVADTITAAAKPTISAAVKATDTTLTGWTTSITAGDVLAFNVDSVATFTRVLISLKVKKS